MDGYTLQESKSVIIKMGSISLKNYPAEEVWYLGSKEMPKVDKTMHMGIIRCSSNSQYENVTNNINKARRALYSLMGTGLHGENGLDPETAISLLQTYILPILFYGLEVVVPTGSSFNTLEKQYKRVLKQILSLPTNTADPAIYILSGLLPAEAIIHKRMLSLFGNISRLDENSIERKLALRQLELKSHKSHSWLIAAKKVLIQYDLPRAEDLLQSPLPKNEWKKLYDIAINTYWTNFIVSQASLCPSLQYLTRIYTVGKCHPSIKPYLSSIRDVQRIPVKCKLLTGTLILQSNRAKFNQNGIDPICPLCKANPETISHFLIECKPLEHVRNPILKELKDVLDTVLYDNQYQRASQPSLQKLIIDCSVLLLDSNTEPNPQIEENLSKLHFISRRLTYALYCTRFKMLMAQKGMSSKGRS